MRQNLMINYLIWTAGTLYMRTLASIVCGTSIAVHSITDIFSFTSGRRAIGQYFIERVKTITTIVRPSSDVVMHPCRRADVGSKQRTLTRAISNVAGIEL
jgi:hypothetical protein